MNLYARFALIDRLFWWWGFWRTRPRIYVHNSELKKADAYARYMRYVIAGLMRDAPRRRPHRDLLTGMLVALTTGRIRRRIDSRPGPWLRKWKRPGLKGKLIGTPLVYESPKHARVGETAWAAEERENVYAVATRAMRRHGGTIRG